MNNGRVASPPRSRPGRFAFTKQDKGLLFIAPWIIGFAIFTLVPMLVSFYDSFFSFNFLTDMKFVGLKNYADVFSHKDFIKSVTATATFVFFSVPLKLLMALALAMLLSRGIGGVNFYRSAIYLPSIMGGSVAIGILWRLMFNKQGMVNQVLGAFGITGQAWLGSPDTAIYILCLLPMWQVGSSMVTFLAAIKQVPATLYEAADIDGAGPVRKFLRITLPMISPMILFNLVMQMISAFQEFASPFIITGGGPLKTTYLFAMFIYEQAFTQLKMGFASAMSWVLFAAILLVTLIIFATSNRWTFYEDGGKSL